MRRPLPSLSLWRTLPWLVFAGLALFILLPILGKGYVLAVDMVFAPRIPLPAADSPTWLFYGVLKAVSFALPVWLIQKILLAAIFIGAGFGAYNLVRTAFPAAGTAGWYAGGILYAYNPFTYTRFMAGQYELLLGYALLPVLLLCLLRLLASPGKKAMLRFGVVCALVGIVSIHTLGLAGLLTAVFAGHAVWQNRRHRDSLKKIAFYGGGSLAVAAALSSNWLVPLLLGKSKLGTTIGGFTTHDFSAFEATGEGLGLVGNILTLQGFWADAQNLYLLPRDMYAWWVWPIVGVMALVAWGVVRCIRRQASLGIPLLGAAVLAAIFALGTAGTIFAPPNNWIIEHVPLAAGYRDSQKFSAVLALAYACFFALGVSALLERLRTVWTSHRTYRLGFGGIILLVLLWAPLLPWAGRLQLQANDYPQGWYQANAYLQQQPRQKVLFLPWHKYMPLSFSGVTTANPAPQFFTVPIVASTDPEFGEARGYTKSNLLQWLDEYLHRTAASDPDFAQRLAAHDIGYIVVAKEFDYRSYQYVTKKQGLQRAADTPTVTVYKVCASSCR